MSTYQTYIQSCDIVGERRIVQSVMDHTNKINQFAIDYRQRCEQVEALREQNAILKQQLDQLVSQNNARRQQLTLQLDESEYELEKAKEEFDKVTGELHKYRELIEQLELNNDYLKEQYTDNEMITSESTQRIELMKQRLHRADADIAAVEDEIQHIHSNYGNSKSLNFAINRNLTSFEDLSKDVDRLRQENQLLTDKLTAAEQSKSSILRLTQTKRSEHVDRQEDKLATVLGMRDELDDLKQVSTSQEKMIDSIQIDLETLREENAYLVERVRKRNMDI
jgi:chromosome segregation ATPase